MIVQLQRGYVSFHSDAFSFRTDGRPSYHSVPFRRKDKIQWECANGGQLWTESVAAGYANSSSIPGGFCATGFSSLNVAFIAGLCIDLVFQVRTL